MFKDKFWLPETESLPILNQEDDCDSKPGYRCKAQKRTMIKFSNSSL